MTDSRALPVSRILWRIGLVVGGYLGFATAIWLLEGRDPAPGGLAHAARTAELEGRRVWLESGCGACHSLVGLGGHVGPDLTDYGRPERAPTVRSTVRLGRSAMPRYELSDRELDQLLAYLETVSRVTRYPPHSLREPFFGASP